MTVRDSSWRTSTSDNKFSGLGSEAAGICIRQRERRP